MLTAIKGYYDNGQVFMKEESPVTTKTDVIITFLSEDSTLISGIKRMPGGLVGKVSIPVDFNDPLEDLKEYI